MSRFDTFDSSKTATAGAAASEIGLVMTGGRQYQLRAIGDIWYRIVKPAEASLVAAVEGDNSHYLPAGQVARVAAIADRTKVSVIRAGGSDTKCVLSEIPQTTNT